jgi:signal transduction histidine kinase
MKSSIGLRAQLHIIIGALFLLSVGVAAPLCWRVVHVFYKRYVLEEKGAAIARALSGPIANAISNNRAGEVRGYLAALSENQDSQGRFVVDVGYMFVLDQNAQLFACVGPELSEYKQDTLAARTLIGESSAAPRPLDTPPRPRSIQTSEPESDGRAHSSAIDFSAPLTRHGQLVGVLRFGLSLDRASKLYWRTTLSLLLAITAFLCCVWLALYLTLKRRILRPVLQLSDALLRIRDGDLTTRLRVERWDELGALAESLNTLTERLKSQKLMQIQLSQAQSLASSHESLSVAHQELAEAHSKLKDAQDQLIKSEKHASLGRLVRGVAHEINNPLNTVKNSLVPLKTAFDRLRGIAAQRLADSPAELEQDILEDIEDIEASCAIIERGVARAVAIVRDLRSFSSLGIQELKTIDLGHVIDEAVQACEQETGPAQRVRIHIEIDKGLGGQIYLKGHKNLLVQLFINLIGNAAQAIVGEGRISIFATRRFDTERRRNVVHVEVEDDGPGMPKNVIDKIFEPFFTTKEAGKGSGLGLALCFAIVEKHDGQLSVMSETNKGTTFMIDLAASPKALPETKRIPRS